MKLTNNMKDAFIRQVMDDVPMTDYVELYRSKVNELAMKLLPPDVAAIEIKYPNTYISRSLIQKLNSSFSVPAAVKQLVVDHGALQIIADKHDAQWSIREALRVKLRAVVAACTTRKALAEALPEFERYLPIDEAAALRTVPVIADMMQDMKKAGWKVKKVVK